MKLFLTLIFSFYFLVAGELKIATFNVENLFDATIQGTEYNDFRTNWNNAKFRAKLKNISPINAKINVFGMHNDEMIIQASQDLTKDEFQTVKDETINAGANITKLLGTSAYYAPAAAVVKMIKAIKNGGNVIASVLDDDEICFGKEIKLSKKGVEKIVENEVYKSVDTSNFIKLKK